MASNIKGGMTKSIINLESSLIWSIPLTVKPAKLNMMPNATSIIVYGILVRDSTNEAINIVPKKARTT